MLDLDDSTQLAFSDRRGLLARAAQFEQRWQAALTDGVRCMEGVEFATSPTRIWLALPYRLRGLGRAVQALYTSIPNAPLVELWEGQTMTSELLLDPCDLWPDYPQRVALATPLPTTTHPSTIFLALLACLDRGTGNTLAEQAVTILAASSDHLRTWAAEIPVAENPMKQIAHRLSERQPIFWATPLFEGLAWDWWQRYQIYAESKAEWLRAADIRHVAVMARFPRYRPQAGIFVRLQGPGDKPLPWLATLNQVWQTRRIQSVTVPPSVPDHHPAAAMLALCEAGEWLALYAAALLGVDATETVALDYLDAHAVA